MIIKFPDQTHGSLQKTRTKKETWSKSTLIVGGLVGM